MILFVLLKLIHSFIFFNFIKLQFSIIFINKKLNFIHFHFHHSNFFSLFFTFIQHNQHNQSTLSFFSIHLSFFFQSWLQLFSMFFSTHALKIPFFIYSLSPFFFYSLFILLFFYLYFIIYHSVHGGFITLILKFHQIEKVLLCNRNSIA